MAVQYEVKAVSHVLQSWAEKKGVSSYVNPDELNDLSIDIVEALDEARAKEK